MLFKQSGDKDKKYKTSESNGKGADLKYDVYISYSTVDSEIANEVCSILEMNGLNCWIAPRNILAGSNFAEQINEAILSSEAFVLIHSKNSKESAYVKNEVDLAFSDKKRIIPYRVDESILEGVLSLYEWTDSYEKLVQEVLFWLGKPSDNLRLPSDENTDDKIPNDLSNEDKSDAPVELSSNKIHIPFEPYEGDDPYIYISYKHSDSELVFPVIKQLRDVGFNIWYDGGLSVGKYYDLQVAEHIKGASLFITFLTETVMASAYDENDYVIKEFGLAKHFNKSILPIYLEDVELDGYFLIQLLGIQGVYKHNFSTDELFINECANVFENDFGLKPNGKTSNGPQDFSSESLKPKDESEKDIKSELSKEKLINNLANGLIEFKERSLWKNYDYDGHGEMPNELDDLHNYFSISRWEYFCKDAETIVDALYSLGFEIGDSNDERQTVNDFNENEIRQLKSLDLEQCKASNIDFITNSEDILRCAGLKLVKDMGENKSDIEKASAATFSPNEPYAYVIYAHNDEDMVYPDIKKFQDNGVNLWYDMQISPSQEWNIEIEEAIMNSSFAVVFISPNSVESRNVRNEIFLASSEDIPILPIYLEETELKYGLSLVLGSVQSIFKFQMYEEAYLHKCLKAFDSLGISNEVPKPLKETSSFKSFNVNDACVLVGDSIILSGELESDGLGIKDANISIFDEDNLVDIVITGADGEFSKTIPAEDISTFNFKAVFDGNDDYENADSSVVTVVVKKPSCIDFISNSEDVSVGDSIILTGRLESDGVGIARSEVNILDGEALIDTVITNDNGEFSKIIPVSEANSFNFKASFDGGDEYGSSLSSLVAVDVRKPSSIDFISTDNDIYIGDSIILTGRLESDGVGIEKVNVSILDDDELIDTVFTNANGEFSKVIIADEINTFNFKASFDGGDEYKAIESSLVTVAVKKYCTIEFNSTSKEVSIGKHIALLGKLESEGQGIKEAEVAILDGDSLITTVFTSAKGEFSHIIFTDSAKAFKFQAIFEGNGEYGGAGSSFVNVTVTDPNAKVEPAAKTAQSQDMTVNSDKLKIDDLDSEIYVSKGSDSHKSNPPFEAYEGEEPYIFVSYKHIDHKIVYPVIKKLHDAGFNLWYDAGLHKGKYYDIQIATRIKNSALFITFLTKEVIKGSFNDEDYVIKEFNAAKRTGRERLQIFLEDVEVDGFYLMNIEGKQQIFRHSYDDENLFIDECVNAFIRDFNLKPKKRDD
ncbi:MAG: TIR domain-containing protein [Methanobrevibacter sp.]|nr:TIR domain-containing protein [Methanobrevibacter sp.]